MLTVPELILPAVRFNEADFARKLDARRWRSRERNTRSGPSALHGRGSFATRYIPRGAPVLVSQPATGNFPINHSDTPNCARSINRAGLFALREIEAGEELTEDYRYLPYFQQAIPVLPERLVRATAMQYVTQLRRAGFDVEKVALGAPAEFSVPSR